MALDSVDMVIRATSISLQCIMAYDEELALAVCREYDKATDILGNVKDSVEAGQRVVRAPPLEQ